MSTRRGATRLFVEAAIEAATDDCILWPYGLHPSGYPTARDATGVYKPTRRVCERTHGMPPTAKHHAAHLCGNRRCINGRHLTWATAKENDAHKDIHGTRALYRPARQRLTVEQARSVKQRVANGEYRSHVGRDFGISGRAVTKIVRGQTYRNT